MILEYFFTLQVYELYVHIKNTLSDMLLHGSIDLIVNLDLHTSIEHIGLFWLLNIFPS